MIEEYKVIKAFGPCKKGDILKLTTDGSYEMKTGDENSLNYCLLGYDTIRGFVEQGYLVEFVKDEDYSWATDKIQIVSIEIEKLIERYKLAQRAVKEEFKAGKIKECEKVEATTVHSNLIEVLMHLKGILDE